MKILTFVILLLPTVLISLCTTPTVESQPPTFNINEINFCNVDSDCQVVADIGTNGDASTLCCSRAYTSINKQFVDSWNSNVTKYFQINQIDCSQAACGPLPSLRPVAVCVNNKCV